MDKLILIDGNNIIYRAFFAMPPLTNTAGQQTNAVYGFTTMLLRLIEEHKPSHLIVAFDAGKITFRHEGYEDYKGGRQKTPPELSEQFPLLKDLLRDLGVPQFEISGYEADDIIGSISREADAAGREVMIVSGDKDMLQLASEHTTIALVRKGVTEVELYGPQQIREKYDLTPEQIIDLKGLMGDASDNIPGVPGVGEKTALKLLHQFGSVEGVLAGTGELKGKMKEKLEEHADSAVMSKKLATIYREVPLEHAWEDMSFAGINRDTAGPALAKLEFKSLLERLSLSAYSGAAGEDTAAEAAEAAELDITIVEEGGLEALIAALPGISALHVETNGENPHRSEVIGIGLSSPEQHYYVPFALLQSPAAAPLRDWLGDSKAPKSGYDLHRSDLALHWQGIAFAGAANDVQLAAYLLDPTEANQNLNDLTSKYGLPRLSPDEDVFGKGAKYKIPELEILGNHVARKSATVLGIVEKQQQELQETGMTGLFEDLEMPLSRILADMEKQGIAVNKEELKKLGKEFEAQIASLVAEIYEICGTEFNLNSPKQLGEILFVKLGLPVVKKTKTGYSTDAEVLEKLAPYHDVVRLILQYRTIAKLQSTYVEGLLKEISEQTGKVHTFYRQTIAATGRLSSQFPNLQNIPIRLEEGRKLRKIFVPSEPGWSILAADYSQIELRVLAHISGDERMKEAFLEDMDIHTKTAMDVFGVTADQVDSNMRRSAKAVNFGIVYGISDYGLSQNLNIPRKEAAQFIEQYFEVFQGVRKYMDDIVQDARKQGYVTTLLERRRYLPEINAKNFNLRSFAERTAMNTPIQGTAADIIKLAMVHMDKALFERGLKSRMLLQVHDELVFEVPEEELELMKQLVPEVMAGALKLSVPLKAEVSYGSNWYEAK
ncbi:MULTISPECIES: DNA polymerase I [unclassified Paenibacillus]|uniref:DNA polymerase I n=1 Tax=unclassified Paenibacillus TaxID=185978 RepID=UPI002404E195|nr:MULTISPECIES: DNA polymerase I [unclassified Paenibacillus]MDF9845226.1 DNA polymerase-1 [Paenibacillus sp. PastF-2]MDF9851793.1 DNA polymerase-1 [Paenibacillus sp. PastM-2]MDF9858392.1 DNA polymerase-1 [Paenibacillus sp. PastF-1]MDH6483681.1 DNA polymerase-1 [Paenibacillus sp. PastH-2]MDH6511026.1 DNA polymerase-1 [Paenibacillus sp. PastM-3]